MSVTVYVATEEECSVRACWCCVAFRSNYYDPSDVWSPLMLQKPLLMDPVNPFSNVADPQVRARNR